MPVQRKECAKRTQSGVLQGTFVSVAAVLLLPSWSRGGLIEEKGDTFSLYTAVGFT